MKQTFKQFLMEEDELPVFGKASERGSSISMREPQNKGFIKQIDTERGHGEIREVYKVLKPFYTMEIGPKKVLHKAGDIMYGAWWDPE